MQGKNNTIGIILFFTIWVLFIGLGGYIGYWIQHIVREWVNFFTLSDLAGCYIFPSFFLGWIGFVTSYKICRKLGYSI